MTSITKSLLLKRLSSRQGKTINGFNLIELMIVVTITGMLSAIGIPQYLGVKEKADSKIKISEAIGFARECATFQIDGDPMATTVQNPGGTAVSCGGSLAQQTILSKTFTAISGQTYSCLTKTITGANTDTKAELTVSKSGVLSCEFQLIIGGPLPPDV
jgi:prepilin-type N-terminal cleavage/methylation domain-containing protein